jgi:hypothetical protein
MTSTSKTSKLFKTYVLVDEDTYNRRVANVDSSRNVSNPFQNPHAREAKRLRREVERNLDDDNVERVETANLELNQLLERYRSEFERAVGGKASRKRSHDPIAVGATENKSPSPKPTAPVGAKAGDAGSIVSITPRATTARRRKKKRLFATGDASGPIPSGTPTPPPRDDTPRPSPAPIFTTADAVRRVIGGHVAEGDAVKIAPLLDGLARAGLVPDGKLVSSIDDGVFRANRRDLTAYIRDATITDPSRRGKSAREVAGFADFLRRKGVDFDVKPSTTRKSVRYGGL